MSGLVRMGGVVCRSCILRVIVSQGWLPLIGVRGIGGVASRATVAHGAGRKRRGGQREEEGWRKEKENLEGFDLEEGWALTPREGNVGLWGFEGLDQSKRKRETCIGRGKKRKKKKQDRKGKEKKRCVTAWNDEGNGGGTKRGIDYEGL